MQKAPEGYRNFINELELVINLWKNTETTNNEDPEATGFSQLINAINRLDYKSMGSLNEIYSILQEKPHWTAISRINRLISSTRVTWGTRVWRYLERSVEDMLVEKQYIKRREARRLLRNCLSLAAMPIMQKVLMSQYLLETRNYDKS